MASGEEPGNVEAVEPVPRVVPLALRHRAEDERHGRACRSEQQVVDAGAAQAQYGVAELAGGVARAAGAGGRADGDLAGELETVRRQRRLDDTVGELLVDRRVVAEQADAGTLGEEALREKSVDVDAHAIADDREGLVEVRR